MNSARRGSGEPGSALSIRDRVLPMPPQSRSPSKWLLRAAWVGLLAIALAVRLPFVLRVGLNEGGGDEWYGAWRSWCVLFERGNPGNFLHPALFYEAGAALFSGLYLTGTQSGTFHSTIDLLTDFVLHEAKYLQALQLLAAVFGALTIPVVFELGRRISGWCAGAIAAGLLFAFTAFAAASHSATLAVLLGLCCLGWIARSFLRAWIAMSGLVQGSLAIGVADQSTP